MTEPALILHDLKDRIMADPDVILEDRDVMRALIEADLRRMGGNVVDLRGIAMERLEARLDRLEDTHRSVIAAAYENLAGTNQIHRAVLSLLEPTEFPDFLERLQGDVARTLRIDALVLVLESQETASNPALSAFPDLIRVVQPGRVDRMIERPHGLPPRKVTLQAVHPASAALYGAHGSLLGSEALLKLEFGDTRLSGLLALGAEDPEFFRPNQGTDLLSFFAGVVERAILRWIA